MDAARFVRVHQRGATRRECRGKMVRCNFDDIETDDVTTMSRERIAVAHDEPLCPPPTGQFAQQDFRLAFSAAVIGSERHMAQGLAHRAY